MSALPPAGDKPGTGIVKALAIIEGVVAADRPVAVTDLVERLGLPKATVYRLCGVLEREGFLQREPGGGRLAPGRRLLGLAHGVMAGAGQRMPRHAILQALSDEVGETCNITVPDGTEMVYLDRVEAHWPLRLQLPTGSRVPLYCTSSGKLFLSSLPADRRRRVIRRLTLDARAPHTITDPELLEADLKRIRARKLGTDNEEFLEGMVAVAVPIVDPKGRLSATLAVHAPAARMSFDRLMTHVPAMRRAADELSALLDDGADGGDG